MEDAPSWMQVARYPDFLAVDWIGTVVPSFGSEPYAGSVEMLARLRARGATVVVVSSAAQQALDADVRRTGLSPDEVIGCPEKGTVFSELRMRYGRGVVLGDHPADFRAAQEAGMFFFQACLDGQPRLAGGDGAFERWGEVPELLLGEPA